MPFGSAKFIAMLLLLGCCGQACAAVVQNIPLLDNRFRIDHAVESITLLVQRKDGTAPVVVVQPDGSKWYASRHPENVHWSFTGNTDMVRIEKPTPGPWQLVGHVEKGSQVRVLSGVELRHDRFPATLYRGQRLKINAEIAGDGDRIVMRDFYQQLRWRVRLASENRSGDENFGSGPFDIGSYGDNGRGLDERPDDGVFAAELNFNYPSGLYNLAIRVDNPVFMRESEQKIEILPQPVRLNVRGEVGQPHQLYISTEANVMLSELHLALTILTPDQNSIALAVTPTQLEQQLPLDMLSGYGSFFISGIAVGTTADGNEFYLQLPKLNFYITPPPPPPPTEEELRQRQLAQAQQQEAEAKHSAILTMVMSTVVLFVMLAAGIGAWWYRQKWVNQRRQQQQQEADKVDLTPDEVDLSAFAQPNKPD
ncbi:TIGR03503 family protein [uncultured Ferrimonas sp.]|uniref:TIGR03503 family protein n=1 Tax=uncultured Ferrimonas sp. TaxID=432640 RepID=UPI0026062DEE|nr:TIGR03503 family protein [uncultured Ferrimonas sp.]